jgi:hypothetical protein
VRALRRNFFDPDATGALAATSAIDNGLDPQARATIYQKGGYVTYLLAQQLGADGFDAAARAFIEKYRFAAADDAAVQEVFAATSQQDLAPFFATWVRSTASIDLTLEPQEGGAAVRNLRGAPAPERIALWRNGSAEPEHATAAVGEDGCPTWARSGCCSIRSPPSPTCSAATTSYRGWTRRAWSRSRRTATCWSWTASPSPGSRRRCGSSRRRGRRCTPGRSIAASPRSRRGAPTARASSPSRARKAVSRPLWRCASATAGGRRSATTASPPPTATAPWLRARAASSASTRAADRC